jgi:transposase
MSRGHSLDLRERAIALVESGMSRRAAARQLMVSESSAIKWFKRFEETGSFAERSGKKAQYSPLETHAEWLLALVKGEPDLTLAQIVVRLDEECQLKITDSSVARFFQRHGVSFKKKRCTPASKTGRTWPRRAKNGKRRWARLILTSSFLSTKPGRTLR